MLKKRVIENFMDFDFVHKWIPACKSSIYEALQYFELPVLSDVRFGQIRESVYGKVGLGDVRYIR